MICGNTSDLIDHPLPKHFVSAHGASHHAWAPRPHHLNLALLSRCTQPFRYIFGRITFISMSYGRQWL